MNTCKSVSRFLIVGVISLFLLGANVLADVTVGSYDDLRDYDSSTLSAGDVVHVTDDGIAGAGVIKTGSVTDNGGTLIVFDDNSSKYWERIYQGDVMGEWFGVQSSYTTAYTTELQNAIDYVNDTGGGVVKLTGRLPYKLGSIVIEPGVILNLDWALIYPVSDANMFYVRPGGTLKNCRVQTNLITFTSKVAVLSPTSHVQGATMPPWVDGLQARMADSQGTTNTGDVLSINANYYWVQEVVAKNIIAYWGRRAVDYSDVGEGLYINGCTVDGLVTHDSYYAIYEDADDGLVAGNQYLGVMSERNNGGKLRLNSGAFVTGLLWDCPTIDFINSNNMVIGYGRGYDLVSNDSGRNNRVITSMGEYKDLRGEGLYGDKRNRRHIPGSRSFEDWINGKIAYNWTENGTGSTTYSNYAYGGSGSYIRGTQASLTTGANANDARWLNFNGVGIVRAANNPTLHATIRLSDDSDATNRKWQVGLRADANNYIMFESDNATYGDANIRCVTNSNGNKSTATITSGVTGKVLWLTILVRPTTVDFIAGIENDNSAECGSGAMTQDILLGGVTNTITTNIPTSANLEPYILVQTLTNSSKRIDFLNFQLYSAVGEAE